MARDTDPGRQIALIALKPAAFTTDTLKEVLAYTFDQLCWIQTDREIEQLLADLLDKLAVEA